MIWLQRFAFFILFLNMCTVVMGDLRKLSWRSKRTEKEQLLEKFLMDAETHLMQNCPNRHTTILAPNNQLLRAATPIFKGRPYFVGTNSKVLVQSREYANENCVFVFIDAIDYDYLSTIFSHLPKTYKTKVQIVSTNNLVKDAAKNVLDLAYGKSIENVTITFLDNNEFKGFQMYPFTRNCKRDVRLSYVWDLDKGFKRFYYNDNSRRNLNKCPVPISTLPLDDSIAYHKNGDGTLNILGGPEGNLILTFADKLNFTAIVKYPEVQDWERVVNNTIVGLVGDIAHGKSIISIGQLFPILKRFEYSDFTTTYDYDCIVWTTTAVTAPMENVLYSEFSIYVWIAVMMSIIFSCVFIYFLSRRSSNNRERQSCISVTLDVIRASVGFPVHRLPTNRPAKFYFLSYIFYIIVAITAYQTYLASILTVRKNEQLIKTVADIVRWKLIPGGTSSTLSILKSQREEDPYMPYLIDNFEIYVNTSVVLDRIQYKKDFAFLMHISTAQYYKRNLISAGKRVYFYSFEKCIISHPYTILVRKGSALTIELNDIIRRMCESGLIKLWKTNKSNVAIPNTGEPDVKLQKLNMKQLWPIFILYLSGVILSTIIMLLEIKFHSPSRRRN